MNAAWSDRLAGSKEAGRPPSSRRPDQADLSIINTAKFGKRMTLSHQLIEGVGASQALQVAWDAEGIFFGTRLPGRSNVYTLHKSGKKSVIYNADLVDELTRDFGLDFSNRTTHSFQGIEFFDIEDVHVAVVRVSHGESATAEPMGDLLE